MGATLFKKAQKSQAKARIGIVGPSGSGKTYTALRLARVLGKRIAVIDTEHGSASKYADEFEFDVLELDTFHPQRYIEAIEVAGAAGYEVLVIDSLSHAWAGTEGALELADKGAAKYSGNRFAAWRDVTPLHNKLIEAMLGSPLHLIATMRSKMEYVQTVDEKGRAVIKKVGLAPVQRDGMEYEFDIVGDLDLDHTLVISKTRCRLLDGAIINKPGEELAKTVLGWLSDGVPAEPKPQNRPPAPVQAPRAEAEQVADRPTPREEPNGDEWPQKTWTKRWLWLKEQGQFSSVQEATEYAHKVLGVKSMKEILASDREAAFKLVLEKRLAEVRAKGQVA